MEKVVKKHCNGYVEFVRYADDFIICAQYKKEADKILKALKGRLGKFGLELAEDKTRIIKFGRFAEEDARRKGKKPDTFNFLGFTHYCDKSRKNGWFRVNRKTEKKRFNAKVKEISKWLKSIRNAYKQREWWKILKAKLIGHYQYYGVTGNSRALDRFLHVVMKIVFKWLNRRSQRKSLTWKGFNEYLKSHKLPLPRIHHNFYALSGS